jgi:hypothetical protein
MAAQASGNYDALEPLNLTQSWVVTVLDERYPEAFDAAAAAFDAASDDELRTFDYQAMAVANIPDAEKYETVVTYHGKSFPVIPGRTVVISRNGFTDDVKHFESGYDRDRWITHEKKTFASRMMATLYQYAAL